MKEINSLFGPNFVVVWLAIVAVMVDVKHHKQVVGTFKVDGAAQAVKSVTLAIAFDTVASFQPTGDLDDGARSEEKKNSRFPRILEERSTLAGLRPCQSIVRLVL